MDISPKKIKMDTKELLPLELESNILVRLPTKQVVVCQCICKRWHDEIRSPNFIESHTQRNDDAKTSCSVILYPKLYPSPSSTKALSMDLDQLLLSLFSPSPYYNNNKNKKVVLSSSHCLPTNFYTYAELIGSSKGLLCFRNFESNALETLSFWLHNPATGACTTVPRLIPKKAKAPKVNFVKMLGFGHDSKTNDFKILCSLNYKVNDDSIIRSSDDEYNVYSLKSDSWKYIEPAVGLKFKRVDPFILTLSNNALHFVGRPVNGLLRIYAFDLGTEEFHQLPLPDIGAARLWAKPCLFDIKGCLHATLVKFTARSYDTSIWVMNEYGSSSKQSWTKLVDLEGASLTKQVKLQQLKLWPLAYSEDESQILIGIGDSLYIYAIVQCDLHTRQVNKLLPLNSNCDHSQKVEPFDFPCQVMPWSASLRNPCILI